MGKDWYLITSYPIYNSGMEQDEFNAYVVDGFNENLDTSPLSIDAEIYDADNILHPTITKVIIQNNSSDSSNTVNIRQIIGKQGSFKTGNYVKYQNNFWLIDSIVSNNLIYDKALMIFCNYTLNFLDEYNNEVSCPCYVENYTKYNSGTKTQGTVNTMELGSTQMYIKLPYCAKTNILDRTYKSGVLNGKNQRVFVDFETDTPKVYEITTQDRVTITGILQLVVTESSDMLTEDDNVKKMITNYYSRVDNTPVLSPDPEQNVFAEIKYSGDPVLFLDGNFKKFDSFFTDENGNEIQNINPIWNFELTDYSFIQFIDFQISGSYIRIRIKDENMLGVPIRLTLASYMNSSKALSSLDLEVMSIA